MDVRTKRVYEPARKADGVRVLVDRIWPRGIKKETANIDLWAKDIAPSNDLRKWYRHEHSKWPEFQHRYSAELDANQQSFVAMIESLDTDVLTLVYSSREEKYNNAMALKLYIERHLAAM